MMLATAAGGELLQYRNEILFHQTVTRYADAWHHQEPFWFFLVQVIPVLWLPLDRAAAVAVAALARGVRRGQRATRSSPCCSLWVLIVVLFFCASSGKRGVYVLPARAGARDGGGAVVAGDSCALAAPRRLAFALAAVIAAGSLLGAGYFAGRWHRGVTHRSGLRDRARIAARPSSAWQAH